MTKIVFETSHICTSEFCSSFIVGVKASGHSGYAQSGKDIVCAAITAVLETALLGLQGHGLKPSFKRDIDKGVLAYDIHELIDSLTSSESEQDIALLKNSQIIFNTLNMGLTDIAKSYPKHVSITFKEN